MKIFKLNKLIATLICLMLLTDVYFCFQTKLAVQRKHKRRNVTKRSFRAQRGDTRITLNVSNRWAKLAVGVFEGLVRDVNDSFKCLPEDWLKEEKDVRKDSNVDKWFSSLSITMQTIGKGFEFVINLFCDFKSTVQKAAYDVFTQIMKPVTGKFFFLEGRMVRRRVRTKQEFINWITSSVDDIGNFFTNSWNSLTEPLQNAFTSTGQAFNDMKNTIINLYNNSHISTILEAMNCLLTGDMVNVEVFKLYDFFVNKFDLVKNQNVIGTVASGGVIPLLTKLFYMFVCKWKDFKIAVDFFIESYNVPDITDKFYWFGKGLGQIMRTIGEAFIKENDDFEKNKKESGKTTKRRRFIR